MWVGSAILTVGVGLSALTYAVAPVAGGSYTIFVGMIAAGIAMLAREFIRGK